MQHNKSVPTIKNEPGAYWFGASYESDLAFADRLRGKTKERFIEAVNRAWKKNHVDLVET